jgi:TetR/AcrR family transcriptional regulator
MRALVAEQGYPAVTVAKVIALAGVSRATFYEQFSDKEDCLVVALGPAGERLQRAVSLAARRAPAARRAASVLAALVQFAGAHAASARLVLSETLAAGQRALDARDETIATLALVIEQGYAGADPGTAAPDIPSGALVGGVSRILALHLNRREPVGLELLAELDLWLASYRVPLAGHRWRKLAPQPPLPRTRVLRAGPLQCPPDPGERGVCGPHSVEEQRLRVMFATAELVGRLGYDAVTVAEIARVAGVDSTGFYRVFAGKRDALRACGELLFGQLMAVSAGAFVVGERWPERLLEAARALLQCLEDNPVLGRAAIVGSHAAGACSPTGLGFFAERFGIFLEEGFRYQPGPERPPEICLQGITMTVLELGYQVMRSDGSEHLTDLLGQVGFVALAPFLTADHASAILREHIPPGAS